MEITEVNVSIYGEAKLRAFVNVTFDNVFVVRGLKIIHGQNGLFVCMPSRRMLDGNYRDIAHPVTNEFRAILEKAVLDEYQRLIELGISSSLETF